MPAPDRDQFAEFVADIEPGVRRALADELGPEAGREATLDALAFSWANWDRVTAAPDPSAYLVKVGQTAGERYRGLVTGDVVPILPRSQTAFDALVPPITAEAAIARAEELVHGAPTTRVSRTGSPTLVAGVTGTARRGEGLATMKLPVSPRSGRDRAPGRRTAAWVVAVVLTGVIALGGIALANRAGDDEGPADDSRPLPTLPSTVPLASSTSVAPAATLAPPSSLGAPLNEVTASATVPDDDDDGTATTSGRGGTATTAGRGSGTGTTAGRGAGSAPVATDDDGAGSGTPTTADQPGSTASSSPRSTEPAPPRTDAPPTTPATEAPASTRVTVPDTPPASS